MGTPDFAVPTLKRLLQGWHVVAVYTQPDRPSGRGRACKASAVKEVALAHCIPVIQPKTLRRPEVVDELASFTPDVVVYAAYGLIIPGGFLQTPPHGCINVHASLLPRWRGASPVTAAILAGDEESGCSIMLADEGLDTGPVLLQQSIPIALGDTAETLSTKLAHLGADLLAETLPRWLAGEIDPTPQDDAQATYAPMIRKEQGRLDWTRPALELDRQVRAYTPWPGAYTFWNGQMLKVLNARPLHAPDPVEPGQVISWEKGAAVGTGHGLLLLERVQLAGRKAVAIEDFVRGAREFVGSRLSG